MFRRKKRRGKFIAICFSLLLLGFIYGYVTNDTETPIKPNPNKGVIAETPKNNPEESQNHNNSKDPVETMPNQEDDLNLNLNVEETVNNNLVTEETKLIFKTYYEKSRDTLTKEEKVPIVLIGEPLRSLQDYVSSHYIGWSIRGISEDFIELYRVKETLSPNYYIVKEKDGFIAIFQIDDSGNNILIDQTEIPIFGLGDIDQQKLKDGIPVKNLESVHQILEDYSS
ncbi:hypothetical protein HNQ80_000938 [Anaerosolibacter carboniphilus]|uniref:Bypass of forespore C C-terminal domain-containing protein n=1 Tax=Anaerosolibacter carboniphilus TaxID=1417629 RepID=A0A841KN80_9FIRM|nr:BofC C-terminal domain-containing protein [Anaerosolibacter carboniphilus]MBB6214853.1 hypothetical protein [Anaerosolibacter carboniphilus]